MKKYISKLHYFFERRCAYGIIQYRNFGKLPWDFELSNSIEFFLRKFL